MATTQRLATFAPNRVQVVITQESTGLSHIVSGYSEDSIVSIERLVESFTMYVGADDTSTRIFNANSAANITLSLQQTQASNDILSALYEADKNSLDGLFSIMIKDTSGRSYWFAEEAYIANMPTAGFANSMQTREWMICAASINQVIGGNAKLSPADQEALATLGVTVEDRWT